ncbi:hypothetical protein GCM10027321_00090 [Massilia terrae]|uniref:Type II secretion system protein H n=2 Tax=Massilia terrae TaxID=1811224 RepID=A0ABT2CUH1_9BURK|nr:GspH/FimT family pseudopilin [Massilia terrae]MCS0657626.1 GspH/FimT family pseudopilin [Massilia terrae]
MVELIVVLILIGILGALGAARFFDKGTFDAAAFSSRAAAALRFAQKEAIAQNRPVTAFLDAAGINLCFANISPCPAGQQVAAPFSVGTGSYCTSSTWYCISRPTAVNYSATVASITFDALGRPSAGGAVMGAVATLTITEGSASNLITVEPETGYVH